jgi:hypothetical protein
MALIIDGVTIPENVANAITCDGVDIHQVIIDGVVVWTQSLGPTVGWSGDSIVAFFGDTGIKTSGVLFQSVVITSLGAWIPISGGVTDANESTVFTPYRMYIAASNNVLTSTSGSAITWNAATKTFSGGPLISLSDIVSGSAVLTLETSGGLIRHNRIFNDGRHNYGAWISLT